MTSLLQHGLAVAASVLPGAAGGETVTYYVGASSIEITAIPRRPENVLDIDTGKLLLGHEDLDWMVEAADLVMGGTAFLPAAGDRIVRTNALGETETYEVRPRDNEDCWQRCDNQDVFYRIHSKRVDNEES